MTDFQSAVEKAIYDRLVEQVTAAPVKQHVPENHAPPVVIIGDITFENQGEKDAPLFRFDVALVSVVTGPSRKPLNVLQAQVRTALDRWKPAATGEVAFGEIVVSGGSGQEIQGEQGPIYFGQQSAVFYVQGAI